MRRDFRPSDTQAKEGNTKNQLERMGRPCWPPRQTDPQVLRSQENTNTTQLVCQGSAGQAGALPIFSSSSRCYSHLEGPETMAPSEAGPQGGAADLTARHPHPCLLQPLCRRGEGSHLKYF